MGYKTKGQWIIQPKKREMENRDLLKVLDVLDFMAKWINEVGERDYRNAMNEVHSKTEKIRKRLTDGK